MPKSERPQKGNPHRLVIRQHTFPSRSISRFVGFDGRVHVHMKTQRLDRRAKPQDSIFCAERSWDHGAEVGFIKNIEDQFQRLADLAIGGHISEFNQKQTHVISSFYILWRVREEIRIEPGERAVLQGILSGHGWSKHEEEGLEKAGFVLYRTGSIPARFMNGVRLRALVGHHLRQFSRAACWGIVRASSGEFIVPDWPAHAFVPMNPVLALATPARNQSLDQEAVRVINGQLKAASRRYFFARDFAACP